MCLSVIALAASTFVYTDSRGLFLNSDSWIFKSYGVKMADKLELTASRLHARSAATMYLKHTGRWNVASETSYWCNRRKTSEIYKQLPTVCRGYEEHVCACVVYERTLV